MIMSRPCQSCGGLVKYHFRTREMTELVFWKQTSLKEHKGAFHLRAISVDNIVRTPLEVGKRGQKRNSKKTNLNTYLSTGSPAICQSRIFTGSPRVSVRENLSDTGIPLSLHITCHSRTHFWKRKSSHYTTIFDKLWYSASHYISYINSWIYFSLKPQKVPAKACVKATPLTCL